MAIYILGLQNRIKQPRFVAALATILPSYIISTIVPNAFIKTLSFAGAILVVIAILLPTYLFFKAKIQYPYLRILNKFVLLICVVAGLLIMSLEIF